LATVDSLAKFSLREPSTDFLNPASKLLSFEMDYGVQVSHWRTSQRHRKKAHDGKDISGQFVLWILKKRGDKW